VSGVTYKEDGSINWGTTVTKTKEFEAHRAVLGALNEIPFPVGKRLLIDFLQGNDGNKAVRRNKLNFLDSFATLCYEDEELYQVIETLENDDLIEYKSYNTNHNWQVICITDEGQRALDDPNYFTKSDEPIVQVKKDITEEEKKLFANFDFFLKTYNDEQKKAITSNVPKILCVAGAGSGKTTVLTKRIEFLVKFRSVDPNKILAITFTRKARQEMQHRLETVGHQDVKVETFNSFCEKILKKYNNQIYGRPVRMMSYKDKVKIFTDAIASLNISVHGAIEAYFTRGQLMSKNDDQLFYILMNDCFFIVDYFKAKGMEMEEFWRTSNNPTMARMIYNICGYIDHTMRENGLRDHMDQIVDALNFLKENKELIPSYDHILIDEYQDVNDLQIELIETLSPKNMFCVGDPRQSIFGWRGSNISYILSFEEKHPNCSLINLTKNYRSSKAIVGLMNESIKHMKLPDLEHNKEGGKDIKLLHFANEEAEYEFIIQMIIGSIFPKEEIFILARTNKQLNDISGLLNQREIPHLVKSDELNRGKFAREGQVTLATVHAIKGLEASLVFVIGCSYLNFPCRANEHPVVELIKVKEYDKDAEEKRLFYVAISRAKDALYLTYSGKKHTSYVTEAMKKYYLEHVRNDVSLKRWT